MQESGILLSFALNFTHVLGDALVRRLALVIRVVTVAPECVLRVFVLVRLFVVLGWSLVEFLCGFGDFLNLLHCNVLLLKA